RTPPPSGQYQRRVCPVAAGQSAAPPPAGSHTRAAPRCPATRRPPSPTHPRQRVLLADPQTEHSPPKMTRSPQPLKSRVLRRPRELAGEESRGSFVSKRRRRLEGRLVQFH